MKKPASSVIKPTPLLYAAYIGIDWADQKHDICLYDPTTEQFEFSIISSQPEAIATWAEGLRKRFNGGAIAICTEQKRGPLIYALCKYEFLVLYPINAQTVAKYRQAFAPSRAKSDRSDAQLLVELLLKHNDKLQAWQPGSAILRSLQQLVENRRMLVAEKVRLTNRITAALKGYYPQVLDWFEDKDTQVFCEFLTRYPSLNAAQVASKQELEQFFKSHHVVQAKTIGRRLEQIQQGVALTEDVGIVEPLQLLVTALIAQLRVLLPSIITFDTKIEELFNSHSDAELFAALPGAGPHLAPRLLVAFGEERTRFQTAQDLLRYSGIAPVKESSGQKSWVHWRWSCPKFLRQTFVEWALQTRKHSFWAEAFYQMQRKKGKTHHGAIRALAFKWIRIVFRCWQDRVPYDEVKYLMALQRKGSPLVQNLALTGETK
ncbi:MAG: IS110 family transposase [Leptolyngbyaceae cyanobacterium RM2_2_4]|nr:IS110 family transposase [Leptolyngbyaceae cyanobacterium RM2_2_4]